jgi:hypothetical protein
MAADRAAKPLARLKASRTVTMLIISALGGRAPYLIQTTSPALRKEWRPRATELFL